MLGRTLTGLMIFALLTFPVSGFGQRASDVQSRQLSPAQRQETIQIIVRLIDLIYQLIDRLEATPPSASPPLSTLPTSQPPMISSISPKRGPVGTVIVVRGRGFTAQNNTVYTGYGSLNLPSPDGETLTFTFSPPGLPVNLGQVKTADFPELIFGIYVVNQNGQTAEPGKFVLTP